jgi:hypothetical protein
VSRHKSEAYTQTLRTDQGADLLDQVASPDPVAHLC